MAGMMELERNWHTEWIKHTVADMDDRQHRGEEEVTLHIREFQHILMQLLAAHQRCDRLEDVLCSYARYAFPATQLLSLPTMFGSGTVEQTASVPANPKPFTEHVYGEWQKGSGKDYEWRMCVRCHMSSTYIKAYDIATCTGKYVPPKS